MVQLEKTDEERRDKVEERRKGAVQCCGAELKQVKSLRAEGCKGAMKEGRLCGVCVCVWCASSSSTVRS